MIEIKSIKLPLLKVCLLARSSTILSVCKSLFFLLFLVFLDIGLSLLDKKSPELPPGSWLMLVYLPDM